MVQRLVLTALFVATAPQISFATGAGDASASTSTTSNAVAPKDATLKLPANGAKNRKVSTPSNFSIGVTVGQEGYISRSAEATGTNAYTEVGGRLKYQSTPNSEKERQRFGAKLDVGFTTATAVENYTNFEAPEAYLAYTSLDLAKPKSDPGQIFTEMTIGRRKQLWSQVDSEWMMGLTQPLNKFDGLRPTEQGLMGAFATFGGAGVSFTAFASPLYIPEQGAPYEVTDGKFSSTSPWWSSPPDTLILSLGTSPVRSPVNYSLNIPAISSIVSQASYGGILRIQDPNSKDGFFIQGSVLRSPQNSLALSFAGKLTLGDSSTYGDVDVYPEVVYHTVLGGDIGYSENFFSVSLSGLRENPDQPSQNADLTSQRFNPMTMLSPSVELRPFSDTMFAPKLRFSYVNTDGGEVSAVGKFAANGNVFGPRTMFRKAISSSLNTTLYRNQRYHLSAGARWIEELEEQGSIVMTDLRLGIGQAWAISLQGDVLGSRKPTDETDTFIARFRANDRVAGRVTYLF